MDRIIIKMEKSQIRALSLFSGCGGDTVGMTNGGINVTHYSELKSTFQNESK